jgi:3-demethoxyubiquinol 3-hydroxylase
MNDFLDKYIVKFDELLRVVCPPWSVQDLSNNPAAAEQESVLTPSEKRLSASMMRVNLAGEVAAQGLYRGQLLLARDLELKTHLTKAAIEEMDHYAWCQARLKDLNANASIFNPFWYLGAFSIGLLAAAISDNISLGFVLATEEQVAKHLASHLRDLPREDLQSRAIVAKMYEDELTHADEAALNGGVRLPFIIQQLMHITAQIMIKVSRLI